jgi:MSHA biogenesis protein MshJ
MIRTLQKLSFGSALQAAAIGFESKSLRERLLLMIAIAALLYFIADASWLTPQKKQLRQMSAQREAAQAETQRVAQKIELLSARLAKENGRERQAELDDLKRIIADADALLSEDDGGSLKLSALLATMLHTTPGLRLMSLKTLPVVPLLPKASSNAGDRNAAKHAALSLESSKDLSELPPVAIQQHTVEVVVRGHYLALLPYMESIRHYPKRLFWISASLEVSAFPDSNLHLRISTLSEKNTNPLE